MKFITLFLTVANATLFYGCTNSFSSRQFHKKYKGIVIGKHLYHRDEYRIAIKSINGTDDSVLLHSAYRDFNYVSIGDSLSKEINSYDIFLFKKGCYDTLCAVRLESVDYLF